MPNLSRNKIQTLAESKNIAVNGHIITDSNYHLKVKDVVEIDCAPILRRSTPSSDATVAFSVLYEDEDIIVVDKPAGIVVHPGAGNHDHTLVNGLVSRYNALSSGSDDSRPGIVHRIDKDTSGILVIAKNDTAHMHLARQFQVHSIKRRYICFCYGVPRLIQGKIETFIARDSHNRVKMAVSSDGRGKNAITFYRILRKFASFAAKIECDLHTGRTHQIRVHMSHIDHSLIGDSVYKKKNYAVPKSIVEYLLHFPRQALHAYFLEFVHPKSEKIMHFEVGLPNDLLELERKMLEATQ